MSVLPTLLIVVSLALAPEPPPLSGRLVDARTGAPLAGADITVVGQRGAVRTDRAGRFEWPELPTLPIDVIVILPDGRVVQRIRLTAIDPTRELKLAVAPVVTEQIAVTGVAPTIEAASAAATTLVAGADLELRHPQTLTQALDTIPGVGAISEGQAAAPAIRGLARGRTLIVVDGSRASTERRAGPNAAFLDPAAIRTIEVARGPGSVAYGSDALGGVIAANTRGPDYRAPLHVRFGATAGGGVPEQRGDLEISTGYGSGGVLVGVRMREFDDYHAPDGVIANSRWQDQGVRARWDHAAGAARWSIGWQTDLARDLGRPRSDGDVIRATSPFEDSHRLTASSQHGSIGGFQNVRVDALVGAMKQRTDQDRLPTATRPRSVDRADLSWRDVQLRASGSRAFGRARLQLGADMQGRYDFEALDTTVNYNLAGAVTSTAVSTSVASANRTALGLFAEARAPITRRVRLAGGIRADGVRSANAGGYFGTRAVSNHAVSGLMAVSVTPSNGLTLTAQIARGFRDPILSDRFYRGPVGRGFIEGNPDLKPETSLQGDVLIQYVTGPIRFGGSLYRYRVNDLVERYASTATSFLYRNRGRADIKGVEVEAEIALPRGFAIEGTGETSRGRDADNGTPLDDIAPAAVSLTIRKSAGTGLTSYLRVKAIGAHHAAGPSEVPTSACTLLDAGLRYRLTGHVNLLGVAKNLLNASYQSSAGPRWVRAPARHGAATIVVSF